LPAVLAAVVLLGEYRATAADKPLGEQVYNLLSKNCTECHGKVNPKRGLSVLAYDGLLDFKKHYVVPKNLKASRLWEKAGEEKAMPPTAPLADADIALLRRWIELGAPPLVEERKPPRPYVGVEDVFLAVHADLRKHDAADRPSLRYFSIAHLHNHAAVSERDLAKYKSALTELVNHLSRKNDAVAPAAVDEQRTVFRIDLRDLGWDQEVWKLLLPHYPYGLKYDEAGSKQLKSLADNVYTWTETSLPVLRADWLIAAASRPPLYEKLLPADKARKDFRKETIGAVAAQYDLDLDFADVAAELGYPKAREGELKKQLRSPGLRDLGLAPLADGERIKRPFWDKLDPYSRFQDVADKLKLGVPYQYSP
jgi:serine/threonine-protein kinase